MTLLHSIPREGPVRPALSDVQKLAAVYLNLHDGLSLRVNISPTRKLITIKRLFWGRWITYTKKGIEDIAADATEYGYTLNDFQWYMVGVK